MPVDWPDPQPLPPLTGIPEDTAKELTKSLYDQQLAWNIERLRLGNDANTRTDEHYLKVTESLYQAYLATKRIWTPART